MTYKILLFIPLFILLIVRCGEESSTTNNTSDINNEELKSAIPVEAIDVEEKFVEQKLDLTGILVPKNSTDIIAEVGGEIISVNKELGQYVNTSDILAVIDDVIPKSQYEQAEANVISAESNLEITESNLKSDEVLYENGDISEFEFENSKLAYKNATARYLTAKANLSTAKKDLS